MNQSTVPQLNELLAAARAGSRDALGQLWAACQPYLRLQARKQLHADLQAKAGVSDIVQDAFAEAHRDFPSFNGQSAAELLAWLQTILTRNVADLASRYRQTGKRDISRELSLDDSTRVGPGAQELPADSSSPSRKFLRQEEAAAMEQALERLPEEYRQVIALRHRANCSFAEIARHLGRTEAAARKLWSRAIECWRQELESAYGPS
jgi:RNA polymerase sigma-70 factor (ECF subfamily)